MLGRTKIMDWLPSAIAGTFLASVVLPLLQGREAWAAGLATFVALLAVILGIIAVVNFIDWFLGKMIVEFAEFRRAQAYTARVRVLEVMSHMNADQLDAARGERGMIEVIAGQPEPEYVLRLSNERTVPMDFARRFFSDEGIWMTPVGSYSEGSLERAYAEALTDQMILWGFAEPARGNRSARWLNKDAALAHWGIELEE